MADPSRVLKWPVGDPADAESLVAREWLVTNGLGGYASGTVAGVMTRRYHGLLIAALGADLGRTVMLSHLAEQVRAREMKFEIGGRERTIDAPDARGIGYLEQFRLELGLPVWRYNIEGIVIERRILLPYMHNTVHAGYELLDGPAIGLALRPSVNFRAQELPVSEPLGWPYEWHAADGNVEIVLKGSALPSLKIKVFGEDVRFKPKERRIANILFPVEESRGYQGRGELWSPGYFHTTLRHGSPVVLVASTESPAVERTPLEVFESERIRRRLLVAQADPDARSSVAAELALAADQFIVKPTSHDQEVGPMTADVDERRTIIAGYHWFTDWGRDTMISLEGLTLVTGRHRDARSILRTFANHVREGLIPNMFPEGEREGLYHTADATLWFFHAISRYLAAVDDPAVLPLLYPRLKEIIDCHVRGTRFGIGVDPDDGLLRQGAPGYQLTWMDAKVGDWIVTPRRGKTVEINALWYNALRLMQEWAESFADIAAASYRTQAERAYDSFNRRFWRSDARHLYDVVDGEDGSNDARCRPNQVFAIALPHPVLARARWEPVMQAVRDRLLTPVGLRSLAPDEPEFKKRYYGDLRTRDAAYHQGTVWGWLVGPFVDAWLKTYPGDVGRARAAIDGFVSHLSEACIGTISEIFDAEPPFTARGCVAQAWSVAEVLRSWVALQRYARGEVPDPSAARARHSV